MAYFNNGFPATYQPLYQPQMMQPQQQPAPQNGITWVQGEQAAKSYLVAPGNTVQLWDSEEKVIYLKSADASGMPSIKILDYTIRGEAEQKNIQAPEYATKDDLSSIESKIRELREDLNSLTRRRSRLTKDGDDDE